MVAPRHGLRASSRRSASSPSTPGGCRRRRSTRSSSCATATPASPRPARATSARAATGRTERGRTSSTSRSRTALLCCNVRKVQPLTKYLAGLDAWITGLRRDQWATRTNIRKVEIDHDHGAIVKLNPLAEWTEEEVWDYVRERDVPLHPLYERATRRSAAHPAPARSRPASRRARRAAGGGRRTRRRSAASTAPSRPAASSTSSTRCSARTTMSSVKLRGEAAEVVLGEAQAVLSMVQDEERRGRLADLIAAAGDGEVAEDDADALAELLESASRPAGCGRSTAWAASRRRCRSSAGSREARSSASPHWRSRTRWPRSSASRSRPYGCRRPGPPRFCSRSPSTAWSSRAPGSTGRSIGSVAL